MKKLAILMSIMMLVAFSSGAALAKAKAAKVETVTAQVVKIDAATGTMVVKIHHKDQTLKAEPKMLEGITVGEKVSIQKSGNMLKSIKVVPAASTMAAPAGTMHTPKK